MDNKQKLTQKPTNALKASSSSSGSSSAVVKTIKSYLPDKPSKQTMIDVALFGAALFVIVRHGKDIASMVESMCPDEAQIMEMMKQQEAQMMAMQGGPPPGM